MDARETSVAERPRGAPRFLPIGAEVAGDAVQFRVWAPKARTVEIELDDQHFPLQPEESGYFSGFVEEARVGDRYRYRLNGDAAFPDPASRFQPDGPHGASVIVDPWRYEWRDVEWRGITSTRPIIYELHIGTFTRQATWASAACELKRLADLGVTLVEVMPVAEFPGRFGWGYDGVNLFAPYHMYGTPDDFRAFVDRAHSVGLGVILDVVYNHIGPDGNYLPQYSDTYFSAKHKTEWGQGINYDGPDCRPVREFIESNVRHWIAEYHLDGLRLDATHSIRDDSPTHILHDIGAAAREAAPDRKVVVIAENEPQDARIVRSLKQGGYALEAIWCDDFHHAAMVSATGRREAYFSDYFGVPQEFVSLFKYGILYQGQHYGWQEKRRGSAAWDVRPRQCVFYLENHDQVANSRDGRRLHQLASAARYRVLAALLLFAPQTPLLFQGQEFGTSRPFLYFAHHDPKLAALIRKGRRQFLKQFASIADGNGERTLADPGSDETFEMSRLDMTERDRHPTHYALYRDLIATRQCDPVLTSDAVRIDGAVLGAHAFVIRYFGGDCGDRLLVVNFGPDHSLEAAAEPLLAPPSSRGWERLWYSDDERYGGRGAPPPELADGSWRIPGESAALLGSDPG
jgi:maltooligosyltrehalose trehalohydrolase